MSCLVEFFRDKVKINLFKRLSWLHKVHQNRIEHPFIHTIDRIDSLKSSRQCKNMGGIRSLLPSLMQLRLPSFRFLRREVPRPFSWACTRNRAIKDHSESKGQTNFSLLKVNIRKYKNPIFFFWINRNHGFSFIHSLLSSLKW